MQSTLNLSEIRSALIGTRFAAHLHHFSSVESTSTLLLEAAANGAPEGTVMIADQQTAGRGRGGHAWYSAPGASQEPFGLYLSLLVRPSLRLHDALLLSLATGLAAQSAVRSTTGLSIDIRWPNDLMLRERKLGGILVETVVEPGQDPSLRYAVIGIGINVHHEAFPPELTAVATSLHIADPSVTLHRAPLITTLLRALDLELTRLEEGNTIPDLLARFTSASTWVRGQRVTVPEQGGYTGITAGLDARGFLLVDADDGMQRTVLSGGVRAES